MLYRPINSDPGPRPHRALPADPADDAGPDDPRLRPARHHHLFAAYDVAGGSVIAQSYRRHRHQEFLRFLKVIDQAVPKDKDLHLVLDSYATHRKLRRSAHRSVTELEDDIRRWINEWNKNPKPFVWTNSADDILETVAEYCQR